MELFVRPLEGDASAELVLRRLAARSRQHGLPTPAALTGDWFHSSAVLAPSVRVEAVPPEHAFTTLDGMEPSSAPDGVVGGGWVGYLGYGLTDTALTPRLPKTAWGWTDQVLRRDETGQWWFEALHADDPARSLFTELSGIATSGDESAPVWEAGPVGRPDADRHRKAVRGCLDAIAAGEVFQANICTQFRVPFSGWTTELFSAGSARFHPARAAYLSGPWGAVISLSPELFLSRHGLTVRSSPIKGTLPRRTLQDEENAKRLRESTKDVAENVMIVDMVRNDLGRVAETGGVSVARLLDVQPHPGVWHLVSDVRAQVPQGLAHSSLLEATFPPASVTGAPKTRALELIAELEAHPRELYCGSIGMASPVAGLEFNVAIRTLEYSHGVVRLGVGGGITADSDPEHEWQECLTKAAPLLDLLG